MEMGESTEEEFVVSWDRAFRSSRNERGTAENGNTKNRRMRMS
jgi:hypothetical protein